MNDEQIEIFGDRPLPQRFIDDSIERTGVKINLLQVDKYCATWLFKDLECPEEGYEHN